MSLSERERRSKRGVFNVLFGRDSREGSRFSACYLGVTHVRGLGFQRVIWAGLPTSLRPCPRGSIRDRTCHADFSGSFFFKIFFFFAEVKRVFFFLEPIEIQY